MKPLQELTRPNIWALEPYSSARDEYKGATASVFLDANENPYNTPHNRYPDPLQTEVKKLIAKIKGVDMKHIFLGNGSDEAIDLVYRTFCRPGIDNVVAIAPTYGMYEVCANVNDVEYRKVLLNADFQFEAETLLGATDSQTKAIFLCSPNNPTGNNLCPQEVEKVLQSFQGLVVVDEAYIDFSTQESRLKHLDEYPNLIVLQTFSKAWGCAAIRLGMAFASAEIVALMTKVKYPYNVNELTQQEAIKLLESHYKVNEWIKSLLTEREFLIQAFGRLDCCRHIYPSDANFFLAKVSHAKRIYDYLVSQGIIVRNRTNVVLCKDCLRITIGTRHENITLIEALQNYKEQDA